jgi:uncharacterized membrane protein YecN with MAPEG domain
MTVPFIVPAYGALLALLYLVLSFRVSTGRGRARVNIGSGGDLLLERAIRAHGNFAEYVPLALLLLGFLEMQRSSAYVLHALCLLLLLGRIAHALGISREPDILLLRAVGILATYLVLAVAGVLLLYDYGRVATL